ncbi:mitochondrial genome maintenance MGM101 [Daldinia decipiens]|uniref:mitochondrial genome maintenance MGM101 n=1 Tax=Daldinia decipiens TaxID=326647 RepID=UPI0020C4C636|nr:mitochondrial genome maintenance MGM101 [Daldinia decipiens]KAI1662022.1 mitochondrial genome maintenance MGM101 [Daldinia decipiens]
MASRTLTPIRAAARRARTISIPQSQIQPSIRTLVSISKPKAAFTPYTKAPASTTATAKPSSIPAAPSAASSPAEATPAAPSGTRTPVPAVSGVPLPDAPSSEEPNSGEPIDWTQSYHGLGTSAFSPETATVLQARLNPEDIEVKPDGIIYLPEIKYRRILNTAFGPGGWGLAPRGQLMVHERLVTRDYALVVHGRFVAQARGEMSYFSEEGISTAAEGCKSNALMRCCKDLGIASELWDPRYIRKFMKEHAMQVWVEHVTTKKRKQIWLRKDDEIRYPFKKTS